MHAVNLIQYAMADEFCLVKTLDEEIKASKTAIGKENQLGVIFSVSLR